MGTMSRRDFNRYLGTAGLVAVATPILAACDRPDGGPEAESTLDRARREGFIRVAFANEPPYAQLEGAEHISGAAPDVAAAVMAELGVPELAGVITEYRAMIPGLQAGRFDLITAGLFINPDRCAEILYSDPDVCSTQSFAVLPGNPLGLLSVADILGTPEATVATLPGDFNEDLAREAGVPSGQITNLPDGLAGIDALATGRIDAFFHPTLSLNDLEERARQDFEITPPLPDTPVSCAGAGFRQEDEEFRDAYNEAFRKLKEDGTFADIVEPYGFSPEAAIEHTAEELCQG